MTVRSRLRIVKNRDPLGRALRERYLLVQQFPSGRQIVKRKVNSRPAAFGAARQVLAPQTSPTVANASIDTATPASAGGDTTGTYVPDATPQDTQATWKTQRYQAIMF